MEGLQSNALPLPRAVVTSSSSARSHTRTRRRRRIHKPRSLSKSVSSLSRASDAHSLDDSVDTASSSARGDSNSAVRPAVTRTLGLSSGKIGAITAGIDAANLAGAAAIQLVAPPCEDCAVAPRSVLFFCCLKLRVCGRCMRRRLAGLNQPLIDARALGQRSVNLKAALGGGSRVACASECQCGQSWADFGYVGARF